MHTWLKESIWINKNERWIEREKTSYYLQEQKCLKVTQHLFILAMPKGTTPLTFKGAVMSGFGC